MILLQGLCMVYVAAHVGFSGAILNPFTIGIAQGLSDLPLFSGFGYRLFCWVVLTSILIVIVLRYAARVKKNPKLSPMYEADAYWREKGEVSSEEVPEEKTTRSAWIVYLLLLLSLIGFSIYYPSTTFEVGESAVSFPAVPVFTALFALTGWLGTAQIESVLYFESAWLYHCLSGSRCDGVWMVSDGNIRNLPGNGTSIRICQ